MNIYIYGSKSFKKEIHNVLEHSNIKFKLDADSVIKDIDTLDELQYTIEDSPHDIYLIEEEKIIKRNSLNSKVKFLTPKDGISEDFLLEHSIPDVTIDSLDDLPKYIIKKHDEYLEKYENESIADEIKDIVDDAYANEDSREELLDEDLSELLVKNDSQDNLDVIDDFSADGLDEYNFKQNIEPVEETNNFEIVEVKDENPEQTEELDFNDFNFELQNLDDLMDDDNSIEKPSFDSDLNLDALENMIEESKEDESKEENVDIDLDELDNLFDNDDSDFKYEAPNEEVSENNYLEDFMQTVQNESEIESQTQEDEELLDDSFFEELENNFEELEENNDKMQEDSLKLEELTLEPQNELNLGDEQMNDDFSQLDLLNEEDLLSALNDASIPTPSKAVQTPKSSKPVSSSNSVIEVSGNNIEELSKIFSQLLNNKTIEITIKIKD